MNCPALSVVVPLFNEEANLEELYRRCVEALMPWVTFELVLVNDGSSDATSELLEQLVQKDERVVAVHLSRNFGHQPAISAGLSVAIGTKIAIMDGDLQDPPEALRTFVDKLDEGFDVVYAIREKRKEHLLKRFAYASFYRLLRRISDLEIPLDAGDFCVMSRRSVDTLLGLPERGRFVRGLRTYVGYRQTGVAYERSARYAGEPKYTLRSLFGLAIDGIVGFSSYPLKIATYAGVLTGLSSIVLAIGLAIASFKSSSTPTGWASLMTLILFIGSAQLLSLGIIGEYIRRVFIEVKGRPTYVISTVSNKTRSLLVGENS